MASQTGTIFILFLALEYIPSLMYTSNKLFPGVIDTTQWQKNQRSHLFPRFGLVVLRSRWQNLRLLIMTYKKLYALPCVVLTAWEVINDKKNRRHTFFHDLDWLSCCEQWQSLHLLIWHGRSCMLCSASSNDMRSDQWQTISVCPHLIPRFRLIVFR